MFFQLNSGDKSQLSTFNSWHYKSTMTFFLLRTNTRELPRGLCHEAVRWFSLTPPLCRGASSKGAGAGGCLHHLLFLTSVGKAKLQALPSDENVAPVFLREGIWEAFYPKHAGAHRASSGVTWMLQQLRHSSGH